MCHRLSHLPQDSGRAETPSVSVAPVPRRPAAISIDVLPWMNKHMPQAMVIQDQPRTAQYLIDDENLEAAALSSRDARNNPVRQMSRVISTHSVSGLHQSSSLKFGHDLLDDC